MKALRHLRPTVAAILAVLIMLGITAFCVQFFGFDPKHQPQPQTRTFFVVNRWYDCLCAGWLVWLFMSYIKHMDLMDDAKFSENKHQLDLFLRGFVPVLSIEILFLGGFGMALFIQAIVSAICAVIYSAAVGVTAVHDSKLCQAIWMWFVNCILTYKPELDDAQSKKRTKARIASFPGDNFMAPDPLDVAVETASGRGLIDLTRESDDTDLGAVFPELRPGHVTSSLK